jgi:hypothetical protein
VTRLRSPCGDDADLAGGGTAAVGHQTFVANSAFEQQPPERGCGLVGAHTADHEGHTIQGAHVGGDIGGAAEAEFVALKSHDRDGRFRRNAIHAANHKVIKHQVADDGDGRWAQGHSAIRAA